MSKLSRHKTNRGLTSIGKCRITVHFVGSDATRSIEQNVYHHTSTGQFFVRYQKLWRHAVYDSDGYHIVIRL